MKKLRVIIASTPLAGHVSPLLGVARGLVERGHEVVINTGSLFRNGAEKTGARFVPLHPEIDYDYRRIDEQFPERAQLPPGPAQMLFGMKHLYTDAIPRQAEGLRLIQEEFQADAILIDILFCGALPFLLGPREQRLPIVSLGITTIMMSSVDTAYFGLGLPPSSTPRARARNAALNASWQQKIFGPLQDYLNETLARLGCPPMPAFLSDAGTLLPDLYLQLGVPSFEYPRSDLPPNVRFVGPVIPPAPDLVAPPWWADLDGGKPVIVANQGTVANLDLGQLVAPTTQALKDDDVLVIAGTGGPPVETIPGPIPANARTGTFLPFHHLLPKADVLVTNGGMGGVTHALSLGLPLIVAGDSEEKPEVAQHVAWAGAGINLATGRPSPELIREAVMEILANPGYRHNARRLARDFAAHDPIGSIESALLELT